METSSTGELLKTTLSFAVPLWILEFQGMSWDRVAKITAEASEHLAHHGDDVLFKNKKKGENAKAFNHLARGIAALAFVPGGVRIYGLHFEAVHPDSLGGKNGRWMYRPAMADELPPLARKGLLPYEGKIYLVGTIDQAAAYGRLALAEELEKKGSSWNPVLLRIHSAHLPDVTKDKRGFDDWFVSHPISAFFVQAWEPKEKAWVAVPEAVEHQKFQDYRTDKIAGSPQEFADAFVTENWPEY
jgi:hypothetical protein